MGRRITSYHLCGHREDIFIVEGNRIITISVNNAAYVSPLVMNGQWVLNMSFIATYKDYPCSLPECRHRSIAELKGDIPPRELRVVNGLVKH